MKLCIRGSILRGAFPRSDIGLTKTEEGPYPNWVYSQASSPGPTGPGYETQRCPQFLHTNLSSLTSRFILCCIQPDTQASPVLSFFIHSLAEKVLSSFLLLKYYLSTYHLHHEKLLAFPLFGVTLTFF